jgi:hypothetical protein
MYPWDTHHGSILALCRQQLQLISTLVCEVQLLQVLAISAIEQVGLGHLPSAKHSVANFSSGPCNHKNTCHKTIL